MNLNSDNVAAASQPVLDALIAANREAETPYGGDRWTARAETLLSEVFEREVQVFLVATGTAANALSLAAMTPPWGAIFCHELGHINLDECGAPEMFSSGAKLIGLPGDGAKLRPEVLERALVHDGGVHHVKPAALSLSNLTECGTVYRPGEISALAALAHAHGLGVHLDGARFANAVIATGASPAELTWRAGVDILSFGATKNGCFAAEAIVVFKPELAETLAYRRKRSGHLVSKGRLLGAQLVGHLEGGHWLDCARHANACAARLATGLTQLPGVSLAWPCDGNEVFPVIPEAVAQRILAAGLGLRPWVKDAFADRSVQLYRLVCAFDTQLDEIDALLAAAA